MSEDTDRATAALLDMMHNADTELHPDLAGWVVDGPLGPMLKHPLVYSLTLDPLSTTHINRQYVAKVKAVAEAREKGDWSAFICWHERPYRVKALSQVPCDADGYWEMVGLWWTDTEFPSDALDEWVSILSHPDAHLMMDEKERAVFDALPDKVTVYRGCDEGYEDGLSWTLSEERATWFANRWGEGYVVERTVSKSRIVAYLDGRQEQEVILLPAYVPAHLARTSQV